MEIIPDEILCEILSYSDDFSKISKVSKRFENVCNIAAGNKLDIKLKPYLLGDNNIEKYHHQLGISGFNRYTKRYKEGWILYRYMLKAIPYIDESFINIDIEVEDYDIYEYVDWINFDPLLYSMGLAANTKNINRFLDIINNNQTLLPFLTAMEIGILDKDLGYYLIDNIKRMFYTSLEVYVHAIMKDIPVTEDIYEQLSYVEHILPQYIDDYINQLDNKYSYSTLIYIGAKGMSTFIDYLDISSIPITIIGAIRYKKYDYVKKVISKRKGINVSLIYNLDILAYDEPDFYDIFLNEYGNRYTYFKLIEAGRLDKIMKWYSKIEDEILVIANLLGHKDIVEIINNMY